mmetsp:Transcript_37379/g.71627  ORF Transcript_37379/g.71627 Transcript_37379/m.71627 type:complete len:290 (+) Transcript_37379:408-1277(+)
MRHLKIWRVIHVAGFKLLLQVLQTLVPGWDSLVAGDEIVRQILITVHVKEKLDPGSLHGLEDVEHLGAVLLRRGLPLPVQIPTGGVGPQVPAATPVRIHVGHQVEGAFFQQRARQGVVAVQQAFHQALHIPLRHALAGVLPCDDPHRLGARARSHHIQRVAVHRLADFRDRCAAGHRPRHQVRVLLQGVRREEGVVAHVLIGGVVDGELSGSLVVVCGHAEPEVAVVGSCAVVPFPRLTVACSARIPDFEHACLAPYAACTEVIPLIVLTAICLAIWIWTDLKHDLLGG